MDLRWAHITLALALCGCRPGRISGESGEAGESGEGGASAEASQSGGGSEDSESSGAGPLDMGSGSGEEEGESIPACVLNWVEVWPGALRGVDGVALDELGRTYASGWLRTEIDGDMDAWVGCWDASGEPLWIQSFGDALGDERGVELTRAPTGELYVAIQESPVFAALLRLDPLTGEELWGRSPSGITALATDASGGIVVARDQGAGASLAKYSAEGQELWFSDAQPMIELQGLRLERVFVASEQDSAPIWAHASAWQDDLRVELIVGYTSEGAILGAELLESLLGVRDAIGVEDELLLLGHGDPGSGAVMLESRDPLSGVLLETRTLAGLSFLPHERDAWVLDWGDAQGLRLVGHRNDPELERGVGWMGELAASSDLPAVGCEHELAAPEQGAPAWFRGAPQAATSASSGASVRATVSALGDEEELEPGAYWTWLGHFDWPAP